MAPSRLISDYLAQLSAQLPAPIVAELADGLDHTHRRYLDQGLTGDTAAAAAVAEFGEPYLIIAAFTRASPARSAARKLLAAGPAVGACWGAAVILNRAWTWPVPAAAPVLLGTALITVIGLLATAAFGTRYRPAARAATTGCLGTAALDAILIAVTMVAAPAVTWPIIMAMMASAARFTFTARRLRSVLAS